jgi:hypothetical protein
MSVEIQYCMTKSTQYDLCVALFTSPRQYGNTRTETIDSAGITKSYA